MTTWLASILGVVVVGIVVELLTENRRLGNFVRSIYGFVVLLVIVAPLPNLLKADWWQSNADDLINTELVTNLSQTGQQAKVTQTLRQLGYDQAIVTVVDDVIYVNLGVTVDSASLSALQNVFKKPTSHDIVCFCMPSYKYLHSSNVFEINSNISRPKQS